MWLNILKSVGINIFIDIFVYGAIVIFIASLRSLNILNIGLEFNDFEIILAIVFFKLAGGFYLLSGIHYSYEFKYYYLFSIFNYFFLCIVLSIFGKSNWFYNIKDAFALSPPYIIYIGFFGTLISSWLMINYFIKK